MSNLSGLGAYRRARVAAVAPGRARVLATSVYARSQDTAQICAGRGAPGTSAGTHRWWGIERRRFAWGRRLRSEGCGEQRIACEFGAWYRRVRRVGAAPAQVDRVAQLAAYGAGVSERAYRGGGGAC